MKMVIKNRKKERSQFLTRCDTCGDKVGAYVCGSCDERCCKKHDDEKKRQFIHTHFPPEYWYKCAEIDHVDHVPKVFPNEVALFDHITSLFVKKCSEGRCRSKRFCPECAVDLQYSYCVDCIGISGKTIEKTEHYCDKCTTDKDRLIPFHRSRSKRQPTVQRNPFNKNNGGVFQLLCQYHAY
jgi:hypothetical protein